MRDSSANLERFNSAVRSPDPYVIAQVFDLPPLSSIKTSNPPVSIDKSYVNVKSNGMDWSSVAACWLDATQFAEAGYAIQCYESQAALHVAFNQLFASSEGNYLVPALHKVSKSTHRLALAADAETGSQDHAKLQNAVTLLQESFSRTFNDRKELVDGAPYDEEGSKKAGVLFIVNELFSIYFQLNTLRLCRNLLRPVQAKKLHTQGTMGQLVTYRYYVGRLSLFEDQYVEAEENLHYAFTNCHKDAVHNKRLILRYLIPVMLYHGRFPSAQLLIKYKLIEFVALVDSIRKGDLKTFNESLIEYQHRFISQGTYLLLEKCKTVCYRNLFRKVHVILEKFQISLGLIANAFKWLNMPIDLDEVECILANLIFRGYVRGYISHSKRTLVLSKREPFPKSALRKS